MACFKPISGYKTATGGFTVRRRLSTGQLMQVPCGQCIGCRLDRSREWAIRLMHELEEHDGKATFLTLTYDNDNLPNDHSLNKTHHQLFLKKLRKSLDKKIRFFHCGEYGEKLSRPHYHTIVFGHDFPDRQLWNVRRGNRYYTSESLSSDSGLWPYGFSIVAEVTFESAAYVARYCTKKITGERADHHYWRDNPLTGETYKLNPEYSTCSNRPGIGTAYVKRHWRQIFELDSVISRGHAVKPPRFYYKYLCDLAEKNPEAKKLLAKVRAKREQTAQQQQQDNTPERLAVREEVKLLQNELLHRPIEKNGEYI